MDVLAELVSSRVRAEIFRQLFTDERPEHYLRELERLTGFVVGSLQQEIKRLLQAEMIIARKDGNRVYYSANIEHPLFVDIKNIVEKTGGYVEALKKALSGLPVKVAFIFGSVAKGTEKAGSDLDFVVIGEVSLRQLSGVLKDIAEKSGREINPQVFSSETWTKRAKAKDHFVSRLIKAKKTFLIGDENVLKTMAK